MIILINCFWYVVAIVIILWSQNMLTDGFIYHRINELIIDNEWITEHIEVEIKWVPFFCRLFQMHFLNEIGVLFDFHGILFPGVQLTVSQVLVQIMIDAERARSHYLNQDGQFYWLYSASISWYRSKYSKLPSRLKPEVCHDNANVISRVIDQKLQRDRGRFFRDLHQEGIVMGPLLLTVIT